MWRQYCDTKSANLKPLSHFTTWKSKQKQPLKNTDSACIGDIPKRVGPLSPKPMCFVRLTYGELQTASASWVPFMLPAFWNICKKHSKHRNLPNESHSETHGAKNQTPVAVVEVKIQENNHLAQLSLNQTFGLPLFFTESVSTKKLIRKLLWGKTCFA